MRVNKNPHRLSRGCLNRLLGQNRGFGAASGPKQSGLKVDLRDKLDQDERALQYKCAS